MPYGMAAAHLPSGLSVQIDRFHHDGLYLRSWRMSLRDSEQAPDRHDFVLVHGLGVSSRYFGQLAARLAEVGVVHLVDLPGFDGVPHPGRPVEMTEFADLVEWWARHTGLEAPVAVGHSMGSQIVVEAMARNPGMAGHAVIVGPPVNRAERSAPRQVLRLLQASPYESSRMRRTAMAGYLRCGPHWVTQVMPRMLAYPIEDRIADLTVPLLIIRGEHDAVAPRDWCDHLADRAPDGAVAEIPGAGHGVILDHKDETADLVLAHARR